MALAAAVASFAREKSRVYPWIQTEIDSSRTGVALLSFVFAASTSADERGDTAMQRVLHALHAV
jgi:hypothetical protein